MTIHLGSFDMALEYYISRFTVPSAHASFQCKSIQSCHGKSTFGIQDFCRKLEWETGLLRVITTLPPWSARFWQSQVVQMMFSPAEHCRADDSKPPGWQTNLA